MNGRSIRGAGDLRNRLGLTPVGEQVELRVQRGGATRLLRTQIAPPQEMAGGHGQAVPQLQGMAVVEIERGSPLFQRLQGGGLVVSAVERAAVPSRPASAQATSSTPSTGGAFSPWRSSRPRSKAPSAATR